MLGVPLLQTSRPLIRAVLERSRERGGRGETEMLEGSGHFPPIDAAERWSAVFFAFVEEAEIS
jgi:hypothetical protein